MKAGAIPAGSTALAALTRGVCLSPCKPSWSVCIFLLLVGLALGQPQGGEQTHRTLESGDVLRVPLAIEQPPLLFTRSGQPTGYLHDLLVEICTTLGLQLQYTPGENHTWATGALANGKVDLLPNFTPTDEHSFTVISPPVFSSPFVTVALSQQPPLRSLTGATPRLVLVRGFQQTRTIQTRFPTLPLLLVDTIPEAYRALRNQDADYHIDNAAHAAYYLREQLATDLVISGELPSAELGELRLSFACRHDTPLLSKAIADVLPAAIDSARRNLSASEPKPHNPIQFTKAELQWCREHPVVALGYSLDFEPALMRSPRGALEGVFKDLLDLIDHRVPLDLQLQVAPWPEPLASAAAGNIDGVLAIQREQARQNGLLATMPIAHSPYAIFTKTAFAKEVQGYSDLAGRRVAVIRGNDANLQRLTDAAPTAIVLEMTDALSSMKAVLINQADAFVGYSIQNVLTTKYQLTGLTIAAVELPGQPVHMAIRKDCPELVRILNKAITTIGEKERSQILTNWSQQADQSKQALFNAEAIPWTAEESQWLMQHPILTVSIDPKWEPIEWFDDRGVHQGITRDYLDRLSVLTGIEFQAYPAQTWHQAVHAVKQGEAQMFSAVLPTPARDQYLTYTDSFLELNQMIFTRNDHPFVHWLTDLADSPICLVRGYAVNELLRRDYPDFQFIEVDSNREALDLVRAGGAAAYIGTMLTVSRAIRLGGYTDIKVAGQTPYKLPLRMAVNKHHAEAVPILNKALRVVQEHDGDHILETWLSGPMQPDRDLTWVWKILGGLVALLILVGAWSWRLSKELRNRKQAQYESALTAAQLQAVIEATDDAILVVDLERRIIAFNARFPALWGLTTEQLQDKTCPNLQVLIAKQALEFEAFSQHLEAVYQSPQEQSTLSIKLRDGRAVLVTSRPHILDGALKGRVWVHRDITKRVNTDRLQSYELQALQLIADGTALPTFLEELCSNLDRVIPQATCRIQANDTRGAFSWFGPKLATTQQQLCETMLSEPLPHAHELGRTSL